MAGPEPGAEESRRETSAIQETPFHGTRSPRRARPTPLPPCFLNSPRRAYRPAAACVPRSLTQGRRASGARGLRFARLIPKPLTHCYRAGGQPRRVAD